MSMLLKRLTLVVAIIIALDSSAVDSLVVHFDPSLPNGWQVSAIPGTPKGGQILEALQAKSPDGIVTLSVLVFPRPSRDKEQTFEGEIEAWKRGVITGAEKSGARVTEARLRITKHRTGSRAWFTLVFSIGDQSHYSVQTMHYELERAVVVGLVSEKDIREDTSLAKMVDSVRLKVPTTKP